MVLNLNKKQGEQATLNKGIFMEKLIKSENGQWTLSKAAPKMDAGHSVFTMDHVNQVSGTKDHRKAKEFAHDIVDKSAANDANKRKIKLMIDKSKNSRDLAFGMSNHVLAHPSEGLKVVKEEDAKSIHLDVREKYPLPPKKYQLAPQEPPHVKQDGSKLSPKSALKKAEEDKGSDMMFSDLEQISHHIEEIREHMKPSEEAPDWVKAKITEAAQNLSIVAHYIQGEKAKDK